MRIEVEHQGESLILNREDPITISEVLSLLEIPPSTVLAVHRESIVPHTSIIGDDISIELIVVSSGG